MTHQSVLIVSGRFCGPRVSGNGGWTSGALAGLIDQHRPADHPDHHPDDRPDDRPADGSGPWPAIEVTLHAPPPLDVPLQVRVDGPATVLEVDGARVATARVVDRALTTVAPVPAGEARAAEAAYPGHRAHPFPHCFVCGPERVEGDGLRIFPGPVSREPTRVAATWTPHPSLSEDYHAYVDTHRRASLASTWAALDCAGGWAGDLADRPMVLGRLTVRVDALPVIGVEHVVVGEQRGQEGRKTFTATTLYDASGRPVATSEQVWIVVDPTHFEGPATD